MKKLNLFIAIVLVMSASSGAWSEGYVPNPGMFFDGLNVTSEFTQLKTTAKLPEVEIEDDLDLSHSDSYREEEVYLISNFINAYIETSSRL